MIKESALITKNGQFSCVLLPILVPFIVVFNKGPFFL